MASCVLAYSGGLDTSVILGWLIRQAGYEVHAVYVDLGQPCEDRRAILEKAKNIGAASAQLSTPKKNCASTSHSQFSHGRRNTNKNICWVHRLRDR